MAETLMLDYSLAKKGLSRIKALAHPLRMQILAFIDKHGEINVNKIYRALKLEQSITSQHLKILRNAELVKYRRDGKRIC
jgi:ArsR family transcriptional regulator